MYLWEVNKIMVSTATVAVGTDDNYLSMKTLQDEYQRLLDENRFLSAHRILLRACF